MIAPWPQCIAPWPQCIAAVLLWVTATASLPAGPLQVHPTNGRYFTDGTQQPDGSLKAVYLTGSHTWANLIDRGPSDPPPVFDFAGYLDLLQKHHHNFIRLWGRQVSWYHEYGEGELHAAPLPWPRAGPGLALDGELKFDLTKFSDTYFARLRARVTAAAERGIYVSIMLFGGSYDCRGGWRGNPFNSKNNINGVNGDPDGDGEGFESQTLDVPAITRLQEAYVQKVIETVHDLDNVLFEISNEGDARSVEWQYHLIRFIDKIETGNPKQHPVGMTALYIDDSKQNNRLLAASPADWISPHTDARGVQNIAAADGQKVSLLDSDHWWVVELYRNPALGREWVWKSFCRGHNPILMEHLPPRSFVQNDHPLSIDDPGYAASRTAMGQTRLLANRLNLAAMTPHTALASSGYCLANPGVEYVVYESQSSGQLALQMKAGEYLVEWFNPGTGETVKKGSVQCVGGRQEFETPWKGGAVLYLRRNNQ